MSLVRSGIPISAILVAACASAAPTAPPATLSLCERNLGGDSAARSITWLRRSQRADGSWEGRSLNSTGKLNAIFEADTATAYAVLALARCGGR